MRFLVRRGTRLRVYGDGASLSLSPSVRSGTRLCVFSRVLRNRASLSRSEARGVVLDYACSVSLSLARSSARLGALLVTHTIYIC